MCICYMVYVYTYEMHTHTHISHILGKKSAFFYGFNIIDSFSLLFL